MKAKKVALLGCYTALALVMFMIENLFPSLFLPGAKMGLGNVFALMALITLGPIEALVLVCAKTLLGSLIIGNLSSLMYSLTAGLVSISLSALLYKRVYPKISLMAISVASAVTHNIIQIAVFCLVAKSPSYFAFAGYLVILGALAGALVGIITLLLIKYIPKGFFQTFIKTDKYKIEN